MHVTSLQIAVLHLDLHASVCNPNKKLKNRSTGFLQAINTKCAHRRTFAVMIFVQNVFAK